MHQFAYWYIYFDVLFTKKSPNANSSLTAMYVYPNQGFLRILRTGQSQVVLTPNFAAASFNFKLSY